MTCVYSQEYVFPKRKYPIWQNCFSISLSMCCNVRSLTCAYTVLLAVCFLMSQRCAVIIIDCYVPTPSHTPTPTYTHTHTLTHTPSHTHTGVRLLPPLLTRLAMDPLAAPPLKRTLNLNCVTGLIVPPQAK